MSETLPHLQPNVSRVLLNNELYVQHFFGAEVSRTAVLEPGTDVERPLSRNHDIQMLMVIQ